MLCSRCKKRTAVVFVTRQENDKTINEGYCLLCAKELGIQPVNDMLAQMGLGSEEIEQMENELQDFLEGKVDDADGHALAMPPFLQNMLKNPQMFAMGPFGAIQPPPGQQTPQPAQPPQQEEPSRRAGRKKAQPKLLEQFCINLTRRAREGRLDKIVGRERETDRVL